MKYEHKVKFIENEVHKSMSRLCWDDARNPKNGDHDLENWIHVARTLKERRQTAEEDVELRKDACPRWRRVLEDYVVHEGCKIRDDVVQLLARYSLCLVHTLHEYVHIICISLPYPFSEHLPIFWILFTYHLHIINISFAYHLHIISIPIIITSTYRLNTIYISFTYHLHIIYILFAYL